jgi:uncharacterized protein (TIGR03437 family)
MPTCRPAALFTSLLLLSGTANAAFTITDVVNAGSRIPSKSSSGGIAQGAVFIASGKGIGPDQLQQASFPLPTTDGLGGVAIQISASGQMIDAIMVYVAPNEVAAILPSSTPIGPATITVNNNGDTASRDINVVAAAFGIFSVTNNGARTALAFNANADGSTTPNNILQSVQPGQDVLINGTGLGGIPSDETQSGVTDVPSTSIRVYVGVEPAVVVSASRGACCDGLDPNFRIPPGIAAWDVIRFTIPDGVVGCYIPVVVQIDAILSNLAAISIDPSGACIPVVSTLPADLVQQLSTQTGVTLGNINLSRTVGMSVNAKGVVTANKRDLGSATFIKYLNVPASMFAADYLYPENVCQINGYPAPDGGVIVNGVDIQIVPIVGVNLDAGGPALVVSGPSGKRNILREAVGKLVAYQSSALFGDTTPGNYFDAGHYTVTGPGGPDVQAFVASTDVPSTPFVWTNIPDIRTPLDRTQDLLITWTGGIPGTQVTVVGGSFENGVTSAILCAAAVEAGQIVIPSYVLLALSKSAALEGSLVIQNRKVDLFKATGLDIPAIAYSSGISLSLKLQ